MLKKIEQEIPNVRMWRYLTLARFWPKGISYFPIEEGFKEKYPANKSKHAEIVGQYFTKLFKAGILYKRLTRSKVALVGKVHHWEQQYLAEQHGSLSCKINVRKMGRGARGSTG